MVRIKVYSSNKKHSVEVDVENLSDKEYELIRTNFVRLLKERKPYEAVSNAFIYAIKLCPNANPSDIWQHIIYRTYLEEGNNPQSWVRVSGQGFEHAFTRIYNSYLAIYGIRLIVLNEATANRALKEMNLTDRIAYKEIDVAMEGKCDLQSDEWRIFGVIHFKASLAERIRDDAPASRIIREQGFISPMVTLDSKSYPPPRGNGVNYGELGGKITTVGKKRNQPKRNYFEKNGDFTNGYSYNLRTPPSPEITFSGSRIKTLSFSENQPDEFVSDIQTFWLAIRAEICKKMPVTKVD